MAKGVLNISAFLENRFAIILTLIFYIFAIYSIQYFVITTTDIENPDVTYQTEYDGKLNASKVEKDLSKSSGDIFSIFGMIFDFLTFKYLNMPLPAFLVLNFINLIVVISLSFIIVSVIYDFVKALPFT